MSSYNSPSSSYYPLVYWFNPTNAPYIDLQLNAGFALPRTSQPPGPNSTGLPSMPPPQGPALTANALAFQASRREVVGGNFEAPYATSPLPQAPASQLGGVPVARNQVAANMSASDDRWRPAPEMEYSQFGDCPMIHPPVISHSLSSSSTGVHDGNSSASGCSQANSSFTTDIVSEHPVSSHPTQFQEPSTHLESPLDQEDIQASVPPESHGCPLGEHSLSSHEDVPLSSDIKDVRAHLKHHHGFHAAGKERVRCPWAGCNQSLQRENLPRHIISQHLKTRVACACGKNFCRQDVKMKHIKDNKCQVQLGNGETRHGLLLG